MIELDGSTGEGGCRILRSALSPAMVAGTSFDKRGGVDCCTVAPR